MSKIESLKQIIQEARETNPEFNKKYEYWVEKRLKAPTQKWLLKHLVESLGENKVRQFLESQDSHG